MRIVSFARDGVIDCGVVRGARALLLDGHRSLGGVAPELRLFRLLAMEEAEREAVAKELDGAPSLAIEELDTLPAVPLCPLYFYLHANNPTVWKRQSRRDWETTRLPYARVRPCTSWLGHGGEVVLPAAGGLACGVELGVVVGKEAWRVGEDKAAEHIAGLTLLNDGYLSGVHDPFTADRDAAEWQSNQQGVATLHKAADTNGAMGPWVVTREELRRRAVERLAPEALERYEERGFAPWVYDRFMRSYLAGRLRDEAHTSAYLLSAEWLVAFLSQSMRLKTGTILGMGAAGWDGLSVAAPETPGDSCRVTLEEEDLGRLELTVRRRGAARESESPYVALRERSGLPVAPRPSERGGPSLWVLRGNYPEALEAEGIAPSTRMNPILYPPAALAGAETPLAVPPRARELRLSGQLAFIVGDAPVYRAAADDWRRWIGAVAPMLAFRDLSFEGLIPDATAYEKRAAYFLGGCGDGLFRLGAPTPAADWPDTPAPRWGLVAQAREARPCSADRYLRGIGDMLAFVTLAATLLPGDVLSLGAPGPELAIPADARLDSVRLTTTWGVGIDLRVVDERESVR